MDSDLIMYIIIRNDLKMGKGKIASQSGHVIQDLVIRSIRSPAFIQYLHTGATKVCLRVDSLGELQKVKEDCQKADLTTTQIVDAGRTQVLSNTITALGVGPVSKDRCPQSLQELKLL